MRYLDLPDSVPEDDCSAPTAEPLLSRKHIVLERRNFYYRAATKLNHFEVRTDFDYEAQCVVEELKACMYGESLESTTTQYPRDWWEAFKERWFCKTLLKKFPVLYNSYESVSYVMYPGLTPALAREKHYYVTFTEGRTH